MIFYMIFCMIFLMIHKISCYKFRVSFYFAIFWHTLRLSGVCVLCPLITHGCRISACIKKEGRDNMDMVTSNSFDGHE